MNITSENVATVILNLTSIISATNTTEDQNIDNVNTVQTVLSQTASLLRSPTLRGTIPQTVVEMVNEVEYDGNCVILKTFQVVICAVTVVDNIESWPTPVVEEESNR